MIYIKYLICAYIEFAAGLLSLTTVGGVLFLLPTIIKEGVNDEDWWMVPLMFFLSFVTYKLFKALRLRYKRRLRFFDLYGNYPTPVYEEIEQAINGRSRRIQSIRALIEEYELYGDIDRFSEYYQRW